MSAKTTFKILQISEWESLRSSGTFTGSSVDITDGFIHLSDSHQLQGTLDKHYTDSLPVIIAEITLKSFAKMLKYETSRGGDKFPHLYAPLPLDAVSRHWRLLPDGNGRYDISHII